MTFTRLRPRRSAHERAMVAHLFRDDDVWFPYRSAACGRELAGDRLTDENIDIVPLCAQCAKHLARVVTV